MELGTFPVIHNIKDVFKQYPEKDLVERGFVVIYKPNYTVIDYLVSKENTFETDVLRELRGIKFSPQTGDIVSRPLHKFFNIGESQCPLSSEEYNADWRYYEKLDGSMIASTSLYDIPVLHTRKGDSDQAVMATKYMFNSKYKDRYIRLLKHCKKFGQTAIFEFTSPDNRIVIRYDEPELRLIAVRDNVSGRYAGFQGIAASYGVPYVEETYLQVKSVRDYVDARENFEGLVLTNGYDFAKIKNLEYVMQHKAVDGLKYEKDVLRLVLEGKVDDVLGILSDEELKKKLDSYNVSVLETLRYETLALCDITTLIIERNSSRKEMALDIKKTKNKVYQVMFFKLLDAVEGEDNIKEKAWSIMKDTCLKYCSSQNTVDELHTHILKGVSKWIH